MKTMTIIQADLTHLDKLTPLFDAYRVFYKQASDLVAAESFLKERLLQNESLVYMAFDGELGVGFTQLFPTFSSVSLQPFYILNDLYVLPEYRKQGIGTQLLNRAKALAQEKGLKGLALETASDNPAQFLYEELDWKKEETAFHYFWIA